MDSQTIRRIVPAIVVSSLLIINASLQSASAFIFINSPPQGEGVPVGSPLEVSGTTNDNAQTDCNVSVILDDERPYQEATPKAPGDYSEWSFTITPQYSDIEPGLNKITAKASCDAAYEEHLILDPIGRDYVKYISVNVTGIPPELASSEDGSDNDNQLEPVTGLEEDGSEEENDDEDEAEE